MYLNRGRYNGSLVNEKRDQNEDSDLYDHNHSIRILQKQLRKTEYKMSLLEISNSELKKKCAELGEGGALDIGPEHLPDNATENSDSHSDAIVNDDLSNPSPEKLTQMAMVTLISIFAAVIFKEYSCFSL